MRLTKASIAELSLPDDKDDDIRWDDDLPCFGIRLRRNERTKAVKKTFIVQCRIGPKQLRKKLGSVNALDLIKAKAAAREFLARVELGQDPPAEAAAAKARAALTLGVVKETYLDHKRPMLRPKSFKEAESYLNKHWRQLHNMPLSKITRRDVAARLNEMVTQNGATAAKLASDTLAALFSWAVKEGLCEVNPVLATHRLSAPKPRDRVLFDDEIVDTWKACRDNDHGRIVKLLLLTGQRRDEVGKIEDTEINVAERCWNIPGARTKNHRPHSVPLSDMALAILEGAPRRAGRSLIFGEGRGSFQGWSLAKKALDARILTARKMRDPNAKASAWVLHDIRRSVATKMADIGIAPHVVEEILNHVSGHKSGVAGVYNRSAYAAEKRQALEVWAEHLAALVDGMPAKVVPLKRA